MRENNVLHPVSSLFIRCENNLCLNIPWGRSAWMRVGWGTKNADIEFPSYLGFPGLSKEVLSFIHDGGHNVILRASLAAGNSAFLSSSFLPAAFLPTPLQKEQRRPLLVICFISFLLSDATVQRQEDIAVA